MLQNFLVHRPQAIKPPKDLAESMARLIHITRDIIIAAFETGQDSMPTMTSPIISKSWLPCKRPLN